MPAPYCLAYLITIRGKQTGPLIALIVIPFGVNQNRNIFLTCYLNELLHLFECAFSVIRKHHNIVPSELFFHTLLYIAQRSWAGILLKINSDELLLTTDDAQLECGGPLGIGDHLLVNPLTL